MDQNLWDPNGVPSSIKKKVIIGWVYDGEILRNSEVHICDHSGRNLSHAQKHAFEIRAFTVRGAISLTKLIRKRCFFACIAF